MPPRKIQTGPTSDTVRERITTVRKRQGLSIVELSKRLAAAGRPFGLSTLSEIESGRRRVDVDDLMAFAVALDVSPVTLLSPMAELPDEPVTFTGAPVGVTVKTMRAWLRGQHSLDSTRDEYSNTELEWVIRSNPGMSVFNVGVMRDAAEMIDQNPEWITGDGTLTVNGEQVTIPRGPVHGDH